MAKNSMRRPGASPVPVLVQRALDGLALRAATVRKARRLTQADLAHLADVGVSTVAAVEAGQAGVAVGNLFKLMSALDLLDQADSLFDLGADPALAAYARDALQPRPLAARVQVVRKPSHG